MLQHLEHGCCRVRVAAGGGEQQGVVTTNLWTVFRHFAGSSIFSSEINFRKAKAFVKIIDSSIFLHIMTQTMIQTKCGDLHEVEVLKVMKTP